LTAYFSLMLLVLTRFKWRQSQTLEG